MELLIGLLVALFLVLLFSLGLLCVMGAAVLIGWAISELMWGPHP